MTPLGGGGAPAALGGACVGGAGGARDPEGVAGGARDPEGVESPGLVGENDETAAGPVVQSELSPAEEGVPPAASSAAESCPATTAAIGRSAAASWLPAAATCAAVGAAIAACGRYAMFGGRSAVAAGEAEASDQSAGPFVPCTKWWSSWVPLPEAPAM